MKAIKLAIMMMAFVSGTTTMQAQGRRNNQQSANREEMTEKRAQQLAVEMGLDDNDAARFREIYTRHTNQMSELRQQQAAKAQNKSDNNVQRQQKSDSEVDAQIKAQLEERRAAIERETAYYNELRTVLSARQAKRVMQGNGGNGRMSGMQRGGMMQRGPQMGMQRGGMMQRGRQMPGAQRGGQMGMQRGGMMQRGPQMGMQRSTYRGMQPGTPGMPHHKMSKKEMKKARKAFRKSQKKMQKQMKKAKKQGLF